MNGMINGDNHPEVMEAVNAAIEAVSALPQGEWPWWTMWFIEGLDDSISEPCELAVFDEVLGEIAGRLSTGHWTGTVMKKEMEIIGGNTTTRRNSKMPKISIKMHRYGDTGWQWEELVKGKMSEYRTNREGDGLWVLSATSSWCPETGKSVLEFKQVQGTCQFGLPADRKKAYDKLYHLRECEEREWAELDEWGIQ